MTIPEIRFMYSYSVKILRWTSALGFESIGEGHRGVALGGRCLATGCLLVCHPSCYRRTISRSCGMVFALSRRGRAFSTCKNKILDGQLATTVGEVSRDKVIMEEYEDLLLNSCATNSETALTGVNTSGDLKAGENVKDTLTLRAAALIDGILDLLPSDGRGIRVTTVAQSLDIEAVSEACGSVLAFIQLFPKKFLCYQLEEEDGSGRWYVRRAGVVNTTEHPLVGAAINKRTADHTAGYGAQARPLHCGIKLHNFLIGASEEEKRFFFVEFQGALPVDKPVATFGLLSALSAKLQSFVRATGGGLLRLLKDKVAGEYIDLSADNALVSIRGVLGRSDVPLFHHAGERVACRSASLPAGTSSDYAEDAWDVELDLDGEYADTKDLGDISFDDSEDVTTPDEDFFHGKAQVAIPTASGRVYDGGVIPLAPPKPADGPPKRKTSLSIPQSTGSRRISAKRFCSEDVHTGTPPPRGKHSPSQLLDLFVECIPTFYIPVRLIKVSHSLARVIGPQSTIHELIKTYSYYFDRDAARDAVRLKDELQHNRLGAANTLYQNCEGTSCLSEPTPCKLQRTYTTRAFSMLQLPSRAGGCESSFGRKQLPDVSSNSPSATVKSPLSAVFATLEALPHDRYISTAEWAETTGVTVQSLQDFIELHSHQHYFLTTAVLQKPNDVMSQWRLRPYWLAPNCSGELGEDSSPEIVSVVKLLKPFWTPIDKLFQKLPSEHRRNVEVVAMKHGGPSTWLRAHGRICWVDETGVNVRKYCASEELDDILHVVISFIKHQATMDHIKLHQIVENNEKNVNTRPGLNLGNVYGISSQIAHGLRTLSPEDKQQNGKLLVHDGREIDIKEFLLRHRKHLDVIIKENEIWVARRSLFRNRA